MSLRARAVLARGLAFVAILGGCMLLPPEPPPPPFITELIVVPESVWMDPADTLRFQAYGRTSEGDSVGVTVTWSATAGTIAGDGLYTADASDAAAVVTAALSEPVLERAAEVRKRRVTAVRMEPRTAILPPGGSQTFVLRGVRNSGDTVNLSAHYAAAGGAISSDGMYDAGPDAGTYAVVGADPRSQLADTSTVTISTTPPPVASVNVRPEDTTIVEGETVRLTATPKDASGNALGERSATWTSSNPGVATVSAGGLVAGVASGTATISATIDGRTDASVLAVTARSPAPVAAVTVTPATATVEPGSAVQLSATTTDSAGHELGGRVVQWTTNNVNVASVTSKGLVTGAAAGTATITATSEGRRGTAAVTVVAPPPEAVVVVGAGDIASCDGDAQATALLLDGIAGTVFTVGDNAYSSGSLSDFMECFEPTWGRHKSRMRPSPGNHDNGQDYFTYFGDRAGPPGRGYYSYDLGAWHILALNSETSTSSTSAQVAWLTADLGSTTKRCVLAYWHKPLFSSGGHGSNSGMRPLWDALYAGGAEIVVNAHDHDYERFAPQTPGGQADPVSGIRQFVVGTGGAGLHSFDTPLLNSEVRDGDTHGVLKLVLYADAYEWEFIPVTGRTFTDRGRGSCR